MIRKAKAGDVDAAARIYEHIHERERAGELCIGWIQGVYPVRKTAEDAALRDELFVYEENGRILASAILNRVQLPEYAEGDWKHPASDDEVMVMHTLTVEPAAASNGIGSRFAAFYENYAREQGCKVLRIDTNAKNAAARRLYARLGYREAGIIPCDFNGIPDVEMVLLEKTVS